MSLSLAPSADGLSAALQVSGVNVANFGPGIPLSNRNKIINGAFNVNQRAYVSGAAVGAGLYGLDRWKMAASADTFTYSTTANKTTVTIPAGKVLRQVVEGLNLQTGTYTLSWEGTAQGKIGGGSLSASGVTGSITGGVDTTIEFGPGTVANVQLEAGSVATPFEHRPYGAELALCQRYYYRDISLGTTHLYGFAGSATTTSATALLPLPVSMRVAPAGIEQSGTATDYGAGTIACSAVPVYAGSTLVNVSITLTVSAGLSAGGTTTARGRTTNSFLGFSAEL